VSVPASTRRRRRSSTRATTSGTTPPGPGRPAHHGRPRRPAQKTAGGAAITLETTLGELNEKQMTKVQDAIVRAEGTMAGVTHTRDDENLPWEIGKRL
jgi:hypothetical protein